MEIDEKDLAILKILHKAAGTPKAEIARNIGIAASAVSERIKRLEQADIIQRYETRLNARTLGARILAFVFVSESREGKGGHTGERLAEVTGVEEVHKIAGEDCFLVKIRVRSTDELGDILDTEITPIEGVSSTRTTIALKTIVEDVALGNSPLMMEDSESSK